MRCWSRNAVAGTGTTEGDRRGQRSITHNLIAVAFTFGAGLTLIVKLPVVPTQAP